MTQHQSKIYDPEFAKYAVAMLVGGGPDNQGVQWIMDPKKESKHYWAGFPDCEQQLSDLTESHPLKSKLERAIKSIRKRIMDGPQQEIFGDEPSVFDASHKTKNSPTSRSGSKISYVLDVEHVPKKARFSDMHNSLSSGKPKSKAKSKAGDLVAKKPKLAGKNSKSAKPPKNATVAEHGPLIDSKLILFTPPPVQAAASRTTHCHASISTKESPESLDANSGNSSVRSEIQVDDSWQIVWDKLKARGWQYVKGKGLDPWSYKAPDDWNLPVMSESEAKDFIRQKFNWQGGRYPVVKGGRKGTRKTAFSPTKGHSIIVPKKVTKKQANPAKKTKTSAKRKIHEPEESKMDYLPSDASSALVDDDDYSQSSVEDVAELNLGSFAEISPEKTLENSLKMEATKCNITNHFQLNNSVRQNETEKGEVTSDVVSSNETSTLNSDLQDVFYSFEDGFRVLTNTKYKLGYCYHAQYGYVLPTAKKFLLDKKQWVEGVHYFKDPTEFRKELCRNGIIICDDIGNNTRRDGRLPRGSSDLANKKAMELFTIEDYNKLRRWVTLAHFPPDYPERTFDGLAPLSAMEAWGLLKQCGYTYSSSALYKLPGVDQTPKKMLNITHFVGVEDIRSHVCRFGILCDKETFPLSQTDHIKVILWASSPPFTHSLFKLVNKEHFFEGNPTDNSTRSLVSSKGTASLKASKEVGCSYPIAVGENVCKDKLENQLPVILPQRRPIQAMEDKPGYSLAQMTCIKVREHIFDMYNLSWIDVQKFLRKIGQYKANRLGPAWKWGIQGCKDEDYIPDDFRLMDFCYDHLGWTGDFEYHAEKQTRNESKSTPRSNRASRNLVSTPSRVPMQELKTPQECINRSNNQPYNGRPEKKVGTTAVNTVANEHKPIQESNNKENNPIMAEKLSQEATQYGTALDELNRCKELLHVSSLSKESWMLSDSNNKQNEQIEAIQSFICTAIEKYGDNGSLYLCGKPGTGKTSAAKLSLSEVIEGRRFSDISVVSIFLNVAHMENASNGTSFASMFSARVYSEIAQELGYSSSLSHDALCTRLVSARSRGKHIFVVIDEVDLLLNAKHTSSRECEIFLHNMFAWSTRPDMAFSLICISNYTDDKSLKNLKGLDITQSPKRVVFQPYTESQLKEIIVKRVGGKLFDDPALEMISRKVAATSGDARRALEMAASCIAKSIETSNPETLKLHYDKSANPTLVTIGHVMKVVRETNHKISEAIVSLPKAAQVVLCVAVTISNFMTASTTISQGNLLRFCRGAAATGIVDDLPIADFLDIIKNLCDAGLLRVGEECNNELHIDKDAPLQIGVQLVDVECALEVTLLKQPYFAKLAEHVRENF